MTELHVSKGPEIGRLMVKQVGEKWYCLAGVAETPDGVASLGCKTNYRREGGISFERAIGLVSSAPEEGTLAVEAFVVTKFIAS